MTRGVRLTDSKVKKALREYQGIITLAAQSLGVTRQAIWRRVKDNPDLKAVIEEERDGVLDIAEGALYTALLNNEPWAVKFALTNLGAKRGYKPIEGREFTGKDGGKIAVDLLNNMTPADLEAEVKRRLLNGDSIVPRK
jgi:hypothetical protein